MLTGSKFNLVGKVCSICSSGEGKTQTLFYILDLFLILNVFDQDRSINVFSFKYCVFFSNSLSSISLLSFGLKGVFHITMLEVINGLFPYLFM